MQRPKIEDELIEELDELMETYLKVPPETVSTSNKIEILLEEHEDLKERATPVARRG